MFNESIPIKVKKALESKESNEKIAKDLFLVIIFIEIGISIRIMTKAEKVVIFSTFVQLSKRFKKISILYFFNFI